MNSDIWSDQGKKLDGLIPENYIVYGELIGYVGDSPIQKHYTYNLNRGNCELYIYRVCFINGKGIVCDLSWDAVKEFCASIGQKHVPELSRMTIERLTRYDDYAFRVLDLFLDADFRMLQAETDYIIEDPVPLAKDSPCDEGVCIRIEHMIPDIFKAKSPMFLQHETKLLDEGVADLESDGSVDSDLVGVAQE